MREHNEWTSKATDYLSAGFSRTETINLLIEDGLTEKDAASMIDQRIKTSFRQGFTEFGIGILILFVGILWWTLLSQGAHDALGEKVGGGICILGLFMLGDGIRRLVSLRIVKQK
ncbi:MAG: hypothetical protein AAF587_04125 [Bacteroidota bacterium]